MTVEGSKYTPNPLSSNPSATEVKAANLKLWYRNAPRFVDWVLYHVVDALVIVAGPDCPPVPDTVNVLSP